MATTNAERVDQGLKALGAGLRPVCEAVWQSRLGDDWLALIHARDRNAIGAPDANDLSFLLKGIHNTWQEMWAQRLGQAERNFLGEARDWRNKWAHQAAFSSDDTSRMLDTAERLLVAFNAVDQAKIVQKLRKDLNRLAIEEASRSEHRKNIARSTDGTPAVGLVPWRDLITPHADVASGRFQQAEYAADLWQVANGEADESYLDPVAFFGRTYLTAGLSHLLVNAATRLSGQGGDPVVDLQTNFGGGKTHSMIALYHLASGRPASELAGLEDLLLSNGLALPTSIRRAVVVGTALSAASPDVKPDGTRVHTIWGQIAYQLAGVAGYKLLEAEDVAALNPGGKLVDLFRLAGPSIVLIDEWVAYARQLPTSPTERAVAGGQFDTQFTFAQALTEAAKAVPNVVVLVSIPASDIEVGGQAGKQALAQLSNVVHRTSSAWKPADDDESFEIVRRRLFEPMTAENARTRDGVIRAFTDFYLVNQAELPSAVRELDYRRRMELSYPIHPELFDRLYKDWSTLDRFQRTRGVLRLMANVVSTLWERGDTNLLIMPGMVPLDEQRVSSELASYTGQEWDPIIKADIDGGFSLPVRIDADNASSLGRVSATRRVARAVFMASAPREEGRRGVDMKNIMLGVVQPGERIGPFADALRRLSSEATYLYVDGSQYWYSVRANISRMANDRALSNVTDDNADDEVKRRLTVRGAAGPFVALHPFPDGPGDVVDDDDGVHLVLLGAHDSHVNNASESPAITKAGQILAQRSAGPRLNRNLLVFCAPSQTPLAGLRQVTRQYLAWKSIEHDFENRGLELTNADQAQMRSRLAETDNATTSQIAEAYIHILVPSQMPGTREIEWKQLKPSGSGSLAGRVARRLESDELLVTGYSGVRVAMDLNRIPLWSQRGDISVEELWKRYCQFPYLPRLSSFAVLANAVANGATLPQADTFSYAHGHDGQRWMGLGSIANGSVARSGLLVKYDLAVAQETHETHEAEQLRIEHAADSSQGNPTGTGSGGSGAGPGTGPGSIGSEVVPSRRPNDVVATGTGEIEAPTRVYSLYTIDAVRGVRQVADILENIVTQLASAPGAMINITLEINGTASGFNDHVQRTVKENAKQLNAKSTEFD